MDSIKTYAESLILKCSFIGFYAYKDDCWVLLEVIKKAAAIYRNDEAPGEWEKIVIDCAKVQFGWENGSIKKYLELYNGLAEASM